MSKTTVNLEALSVSQLAKMQAEIPQIIKRKSDERQEAFRAKLAKMAKDEGYDVAKLFGVTATAPVKNGAHTTAKAAKPQKIKVKYADPRNPANTWSGRGRPARWLAAYEKAGKSRSEFAVG